MLGAIAAGSGFAFRHLMVGEGGGPSVDENEAVRAQLQRILQSSIFRQSKRHTRFLSYVVKETLAGRGARLNGLLVGIEVFDRDETFDPAVDAIVRVEAGRLRAKLREYYTGEGREDPMEIVLPKGGYSAQFNPRSSDAAAADADSPVLTRRAGSADAVREDPTIAVLPFNNLSADPEQEYFSDGITEDVITDLSRLSSLYVISRHSSFAYKGRPITTREINDELGARYILEGSVRKAGDRIRISAQLIDATNDNQLWAERFDRDVNDVFAIQEEVSRKIVDSLQVKLSERERTRLGYRGTKNPEAHDFLLRALEQFYQFTPESLNNAIEYLSRATDLDPDYAEAYAWKARFVVFNFTIGVNNSPEETVNPAVALARKAVQLDDLSPNCHAVLGWVLMWHRDIDKAVVAVDRAMELNPNIADALLLRSLVLSSAGRGQEALAMIERAMELNPRFTITYTFALGVAYFVLGQYQKALLHFERGIQRNPLFLPNHIFKTSILGLQGHRSAAHAARGKLLELNPVYNTRFASIFNEREIEERMWEGLHLTGIT